MKKSLEVLLNIGKDGLKAARDSLAVGSIVYLLCEGGDIATYDAINESILTAKVVGGFTFVVDYLVRIANRYTPSLAKGPLIARP